MAAYLTKIPKLHATDLREATRKARRIFHDIEKQSRRKVYIRSGYFNKEKVFFDFFWEHLNQKPRAERLKRLIYFPCAIDVIRHSRRAPIISLNRHKKSEILYRFDAQTKEGETFYVQIKEIPSTRVKYFMSVFPE